jgi:hypothetical protein
MYGITVTNDQGNVLISDSVPGLHYMGRAVYGGVLFARSTGFPEYGGPYGSLDGVVCYRFTTSVNNSPVVFIKPADLDLFYGVLTQRFNGSVWEIDIVQSGTSQIPPDIYIFTSAQGTNVGTTEEYGIQTFDENNNIMFDSRYPPINVLNTVEIQSPTIPGASGVAPTSTSVSSKSYYRDGVQNLDYDFNCLGRFNSTSVSTPATSSDIMFSAATTTQAVYLRRKHASYWSDGGYGTDAQYHEKEYKWAAMYHQGYRVSNTQVDSGWTIYNTAYSYYNYVEGDSGFIGIGGESSDTSSTGTLPYVQKTINNFSNLMMISDSRFYA